MDLLLDLNIVLDICVPIPEHAELALRALEKCRESGGKIWLYTGSVQTLHYALANALLSSEPATGTPLTKFEASQRSRTAVSWTVESRARKCSRLATIQGEARSGE